MYDIERLKKEMALIDKELELMEKSFDRHVKPRNRKYSHQYIRAVAKSAYLYGKMSVIKEFEKSSDRVDYVG